MASGEKAVCSHCKGSGLSWHSEYHCKCPKRCWPGTHAPKWVPCVICRRGEHKNGEKRQPPAQMSLFDISALTQTAA